MRDSPSRRGDGALGTLAGIGPDISGLLVIRARLEARSCALLRAEVRIPTVIVRVRPWSGSPLLRRAGRTL